MISFSSLLWVWQSDSGGCWHFVNVPEEESGEIRAYAIGSPRGFGSVRVEAKINDITWRTSVFPMKSGGYVLPVKADVRRKAGIASGDEVAVDLELL